jgi:hypothetical protein
VPDKKATVARNKTNKRGTPMIPVAVMMPKRPPCTGLEPGQTHTIYILVGRCGNRQLFLRMDGMDWLMAYAADEYHFQGIQREMAAMMPSTAVADYRSEWNFNECLWEGFILAGDAKGQTIKFSPGSLRRSQWDKLKEQSLADGFFSKRSKKEEKLAAKEVVKLWCAATHSGKQKEFENDWMSTDDALPDLCDAQTRPQKRQKVYAEWRGAAVAEGTIKAEPSAVAAFQPTLINRLFNAEKAAVADRMVKTEPSAVAAGQPAVADNMVVNVNSSDDE